MPGSKRSRSAAEPGPAPGESAEDLARALEPLLAADEAEGIGALIAAALPRIRQRRERTQALVDALLSAEDLTAAAITNVRRNTDFRLWIAEKYGVLTGTQLGAAPHGASSGAPEASRWLEEGWLFSVAVGNTELYPKFEFDADGKPLPVLREVLRALDGSLHGWEIAGWLTSANADLRGHAPIDLWTKEPESVVAAAGRLAEARRDRHAAP
jgi:hypothetical protein